MERDLTRIDGLAELERALAESHDRPLLIFKHSRTCGVSAEALEELQSHIQDEALGVQYALVTVQTHREVSNAIASQLGVRHETPQAILVRSGQVIWSASHFRVTASELRKALQKSASAS